jgi:hypothetical protein
VAGSQAVRLGFVLSQIGITYGELNVITVSCGAFNSSASHILLICVVSSRSVMLPSIGDYFLKLYTDIENRSWHTEPYYGVENIY